MEKIKIGHSYKHDVHGDVEVTEIRTVSEEAEVDVLERDGERVFDVVTTVIGDSVLFIDDQGRQHMEPLEEFCDRIK